MNNVYPQPPSSTIPRVNDTHPNQSTSSVSNNAPVPAPAITDKDVAAKSSKSKGKFKQRRSRSTSPADVSESETDFDRLDLDADEERERADEDDAEPRSVFPDPSSPSSPSLFITQRKGGDGDAGRVRLGSGHWVTNYEYGRLQKMASNKRLMRSMGIPDAVKALVGPKKPSPALQRTRVPVNIPAGPSRIPPTRASKQQEKS